ncbi:MAG: F0F1 ATP synthase subunit epsilon [Pseudomonadota bacterium]
MANRVEFELVSPEKLMLSEPVDMVVVPGEEGDFGVLPGHAPMISTVRSGVIAVFEGKTVKQRIFVAGGFAEVTPTRCTVLAEVAEPMEGLDRAEVERRISVSQGELAEAATDDVRTYVASRLEAERALLKAIDRPVYQ